MRTLTHKVSHFHTHLCRHRSTAPHPSCIPLSHTLVSTQAHNPTPLVHAQMHTHTIFAFIPTHFSRTLTLAHVISSYSRTNAHVLVHRHSPHTCTFTSIHALTWRPIFPFPVTCPPSSAHRCPHHTHVLESPPPHSCTHKHARLLTGAGSHRHCAPSRPPQTPDLLAFLCCSPRESWPTAAASPVTSSWRAPHPSGSWTTALRTPEQKTGPWFSLTSRLTMKVGSPMTTPHPFLA